MNTSDITTLFAEILSNLSDSQKQEVSFKIYNLLADKSSPKPKPAVLPKIASLKDISSYREEIIKWANENPCTDHIFSIDPSRSVKYDFGKQCVAGSAALHYVYRQLFPTREITWKSNDVDIFILDAGINNRSLVGNTDVVLVKERTVEELLLNFDLPVCRVAYDFSDKTWISAQCIAALFTNRQNLSENLKDLRSFTEVFLRNTTQLNDHVKTNVISHSYGRFMLRLEKYQKRGFDVNWHRVAEPNISWVKTKFSYIENN